MSKLALLEDEVLQLPEDQRMALLNRVLHRTESASDLDVEKAWNTEIAHRIDLVDSNKTKRIPASEVSKKLESDIRRRRFGAGGYVTTEINISLDANVLLDVA